MSKYSILPLATALGALAGAQAAATEANANVPVDPAASVTPADATNEGLTANTIVSTGTNLLGFVVGERADGTVVAQHSSHASHASHASHVSSR